MGLHELLYKQHRQEYMRIYNLGQSYNYSSIGSFTCGNKLIGRGQLQLKIFEFIRMLLIPI